MNTATILEAAAKELGGTWSLHTSTTFLIHLDNEGIQHLQYLDKVRPHRTPKDAAGNYMHLADMVYTLNTDGSLKLHNTDTYLVYTDHNNDVHFQILKNVEYFGRLVSTQTGEDMNLIGVALLQTPTE